MLGGSTHSGLRVALSPSKGDGADALKIVLKAAIVT